MVIEELVPKLPKTEKSIKCAYESCLNLKKFVFVESKEFAAHLEKAKSDLKSAETDYKAESWDWVIVKAYYAIHHAINALLVKSKGFYSKDHICAILALKSFELIPEVLYQKLRKIDAKFSDFTGFDITYTLRKISQYDVRKWKDISATDAKSIYSLAKELIAFIEERCYQ